MPKGIGVFTSGGDSPGMNAAVRAVIRSGVESGFDMYAIYNGYRGLVDGQIEHVNRSFVSQIINKGGTILRSARLPEFTSLDMQKKAIDQLHAHNIDALVAIGGDGTYRGALDLSQQGIRCMTLPGTIDNDIASTDFTIGFDTTVNTIIEAVDKLRDTTSSHQRCSIVEVMGNRAGDLALYAGLACGAEIVIANEHLLPLDTIIERLQIQKLSAKRHAMMLVSENLFDLPSLARLIQEKTGFEVRTEVLGRIQRGGSPSAFDRILASRMGAHAVACIEAGKSSRAIGIRGQTIVDYDLAEALTMKKNKLDYMLKVIDKVK
jgi:6-phosphofructokinase 1